MLRKGERSADCIMSHPPAGLKVQALSAQGICRRNSPTRGSSCALVQKSLFEGRELCSRPRVSRKPFLSKAARFLVDDKSVGAVLQINVGKLRNQTCRRCHVDAGPIDARSCRERR